MTDPLQDKDFTDKLQALMRPSKSAIHEAVRNIMFNEIGLKSSNLVDMVKEEVRSSLNANNVGKVVQTAVDAALRPYTRGRIEELVRDAVKTEIKSKVTEQLKGLKIEVAINDQ